MLASSFSIDRRGVSMSTQSRPARTVAVLEAGGAGVAVVSGILGEDDVEAAARRYARALSP